MIQFFAYKPPKNNINFFCRSKLAIINIWENPKSITVLIKKDEKLTPECSISILHVPTSLFSNLFAKRIVESLKVL